MPGIKPLCPESFHKCVLTLRPDHLHSTSPRITSMSRISPTSGRPYPPWPFVSFKHHFEDNFQESGGRKRELPDTLCAVCCFRNECFSHARVTICVWHNGGKLLSVGAMTWVAFSSWHWNIKGVGTHSAWNSGWSRKCSTLRSSSISLPALHDSCQAYRHVTHGPGMFEWSWQVPVDIRENPPVLRA